MDNISIVISSHNRADSLERLLESLECCDSPACSFRVIVVLNDCSDDSLAKCQSFQNRYSTKVLVLEEPRPGLSFGRNKGLEAVEDGLVIFLDDDVTVTSSFIKEYERAICDFPEATIFGGQISARWPKRKPWWYPEPASRPVDGVIGTFAPQSEIGYTTQIPFGGNMAVRKSALKTTQFPTNLGMKGKMMGFGEESILCSGLMARGHRVVYVPAAIANHHLQENFQSIRYLYKRLNRLNEALVYMGLKVPETPVKSNLVGHLWSKLLWSLRVLKRALMGMDLAPVFIVIEQRARKRATQYLQKEN